MDLYFKTKSLLKKLPDDENYQIIEQHYGNKYKLGDRIKIIRVDLAKKQMDFVLMENEK